MTVHSRRRLRRLVLGTDTYLWKVEHDHRALPPEAGRERRCCEVFTAFLQGRKSCPLRVVFADGGGLNAGYPEAGVVWTSEEPCRSVNLNLPSTARRLIELGRAAGWRPEEMHAPWRIDGAALLTDLCDSRSAPMTS